MEQQQDTIDFIDNRATRTPYEIAFKTVAIATTTTIAAGHLTTLRRISRKDRAHAIVAVIGFFLVPTLPFATLLWNCWKSFWVLQSRGRKNFDAIYYLSAALGVRATATGAEEDATDSVALVDVEYELLIRRRREYDSRWLARLAVLMIFAAQAVMTAVLAGRRILCGSPECVGRAAASWDMFNGVRALGAVGTAAASIGITLLNTSWQIEVQPGDRAGCGSFFRVSTALLDVGLRPQEGNSMVELRIARLLYQLYSAIIIWLWLGTPPITFSLLPFYVKLENIPAFIANPYFLLVLRTAIGGVLIPTFIFLLACSVGRGSPIRVTKVFRRANDFVLLVFLDICKHLLSDDNGKHHVLVCERHGHLCCFFKKWNLVRFDVGRSVVGKALCNLKMQPVSPILVAGGGGSNMYSKKEKRTAIASLRK